MIVLAGISTIETEIQQMLEADVKDYFQISGQKGFFPSRLD